MSDPPVSRRDRLPPLHLPLAYFCLAHLCLAAALCLLAVDPAGFAGYFFHARAAAAVHLVTLGWISSSILGALYLVGPVALRAPMPVAWPDWAAFAGWSVGVTGVVSHFWLESFDAMAWAGILVLLSAARPVLQTARSVARGSVGMAVKLHLFLAFANLCLAGTAGILLGFNKTRGFLPGFPLSDTFAHAHLAALGWATMMVMATGYRLFPMVIPAAMPEKQGSWVTTLLLAASGVLLEAGLVGLIACLVWASPLAPSAAGLCAAGIAVFTAWIGWMFAHRRPGPIGAPRIDPPAVQMAVAGLCLVGAVAIGLWLSFQDARENETALRVATVYGTLGLLGFLSQLIIAMQGRLVPLVAAIRAAAQAAERGEDAPPPHELADRGLQLAVCLLWLVGVPLLASGLPLENPTLIGAGAWALLASVPVHATGLALAVTRGSR